MKSSAAIRREGRERATIEEESAQRLRKKACGDKERRKRARGNGKTERAVIMGEGRERAAIEEESA
ncbi:hypothetical protein AMTR_s00031p00214280 [Amborella trichopoda]|uniref:Uncharacterized protein n=1 Tax=Amborella trichopoda TaxID=13333 RepID=U5CTK3_AMBTC|nr:hypothetical protein AMTR_s00031p00214280 [Amborella trichopoda]